MRLCVRGGSVGWLRALMRAAVPRIDSYGDLARRCLQHRLWPAGVQPKPRSLAALFSKFDRGIELEWLRDRIPAQGALSDILGCPLSSVQGPLATGLADGGQSGHRWRFVDAPQARPLDLKTEPLPPSFPDIIQHPGAWKRLWWRTADGGGAALVRRWLEVRQLAWCLRLRSWNDLGAIELPPPSRPLFIELDTAHGEVPETLRTRSALCIASSFRPGGIDLDEVALEAKPPVDAILQWLEERLPEAGYFDPAHALEFCLRAEIAPSLDSFEAIIGLGALLDSLGYEPIRDRALSALAREGVTRRLRQAASAGSQEAAWLEPRGFEVLVHTAVHALTQSAYSWLTSRQREEWLALVAPAGEAVFPEPMEEPPLDEVPREAATSRQENILRALVAGQLLHAEPDQRWRFAPRWLGRVVGEQALETLIDLSPRAWGSAQLHSSHAELLRQALLARLRRGEFAFVDAVLACGGDDDAELACALETSVELCGLARLEGVSVDVGRAERLLEAQSRLLIRERGQVCPRLTSGARREAHWRLAVWALCEELPARGPAELSPWNSRPPLVTQFDALLELFQGAAMECWFPEAHALLLRVAWAHADTALSTHAVCLPALAVAEHVPATLHRLSKLRHGYHALLALLHKGDIQPEQWCARAWRAWSAANFETCDFFAPDAPQAVEVWTWAPADAVTELVWLKSGAALQIRFSALSPAAWRGYLDATPHVPLRAWTAVPKEVVLEALAAAQRLGDADGASTLWLGHPRAMLSAFERALVEGSQPSLELLLNSLPPQRAETLLRRLEEQLPQVDINSPAMAQIHPFLTSRVLTRADYFRLCYELLASIERRRRAGGRN